MQSINSQNKFYQSVLYDLLISKSFGKLIITHSHLFNKGLCNLNHDARTLWADVLRLKAFFIRYNNFILESILRPSRLTKFLCLKFSGPAVDSTTPATFWQIILQTFWRLSPRKYYYRLSSLARQHIYVNKLTYTVRRPTRCRLEWMPCQEYHRNYFRGAFRS